MKKSLLKNLFAFLAFLLAVSMVFSVIFLVDASKLGATKTILFAVGILITQAAGLITLISLSLQANADAKKETGKATFDALSEREKTEDELARRSNKRYDMLVRQMEDNKLHSKNIQCLNCSHQKDSIFSCSIFQQKHPDILKGKERCEYFKGNVHLDNKD